MRFRKPKPLPIFVTQTPRTSVTSEGMKILDDFVDHYYNGDYVMDMTAFGVRCGNQGQEATLGHFLSMALTNYVATKSDKTPERQNPCAVDLLTWVTHARGLGLIKDSKSALTKLKTVEMENERLKDNQQKLEVEILKLKQEIEELHNALDTFGGRSDVAEQLEK